MVYYPDMVKSGVSLQESLNRNSLDWAFVLVLMFMFLTLVTDRVLYLTRWNEGKQYLQLFQVALYHFLLLWTFQMQSGSETIQVLYVFKAMYFGLSAVQIRDKYPMYTQGEYLTR